MTILNHTHVSSVLTSIDQAKGLPNEFYISPQVFEEEKLAILFNHWSGIGFAKDIPAPGDVKPVEFLGMPLLIVRDKKGAISVFQNTCRHRGMILVEKARNIRATIRCPYHSWCYGLDGSLKTTPYVGGVNNNDHDSIDKKKLGLFEIRAYVWRDIIFVNLSGDAPDFIEYAADLMKRWKEFEQPIFHGGLTSSLKLDVKTNWKLAVENYCESYHLPWVHPGLNSYSKLEDHYPIENPASFSGQGTTVYRQLTAENGHVFPDFEQLSEKWNEAAEYIAFYPNVLLGVHRDHCFAIILEPVSVDRTIEHVEIYYAQPPTDSAEIGAMKDANAKLWKSVFDEDIFVVEGMQRGRHGILFDGGKFSPAMDNATHNFHRWVAVNITAWREQST